MRWIMLLTALALLLLGCGGGGGGSPPGTGGGAASDDGFGFTLTSYARTAQSSTTAAGTAATGLCDKLGTGLVPVEGQLLAEKLGPDGGETIYDYSLCIDEDAFQIVDEVTLPLEAGVYNFFFVLTSGGKYYAGAVLNRIVADGINTIAFTLNPVIGDGVVDVYLVQSLAEFLFAYSAIEISSYADPQFSIVVTDSAGVVIGGEDNLFSINPATGLPVVYVLLPPGDYTFVLRFYDGGLLKVVVESDVTITEGGGTLEIDWVPIHIEVTYTFDPGNEEATFNFSVPGDIVDEAGGLAELEALASIVGAKNPLFEQILELTPSGDNFVGGFTLAPFVEEEKISWSIQFRDKGSEPPELFAFCAQKEVALPQSGTDPEPSETFICEPSFVERDVEVPEPVATLIVDAREKTTNSPLAGAVISVDGEAVGITGDGLEGTTEGLLEVFLPPGTYSLSAIHQALVSGEIVTLTTAEPVEITLISEKTLTQELFLEPGSGSGGGGGGGGDPVDTVTVTASREVRPTRFLDGEEPLAFPATIRISGHDRVNVVHGDEDRYLIIVYLDDVKCWYLGGQWDSAVGGVWETIFEQTFKSPACTKGYGAGDTLDVTGPIRARVVTGNPAFDVTEISVELDVMAFLGE